MRRIGSRPRPPGGPSSDGAAGMVALRGRVVVSALSGVLVLTFVAAFLAWQQYDDTRTTALNTVRVQANLAGTLLDTYFAGQVASLQAMAAAPAVVEPGRGGDARVLQARPAAQRPRVHGRYRLDRPDGRLAGVELGRQRSVPAVNVGDREYFKAVVETEKPFISEGLTTRRTGEHAIVMAVPTRDAAGKLSGVLAGVLLVEPDTGALERHRSRVRRAGGVRPHGPVGAGRLRQAAQHGAARSGCGTIRTAA